MTWFHILQGGLFGAVIALVSERVRTLSYRADLDTPALRRALSRLLRAGDLDVATDLVRRARPAWAAEVIWPLLDPEHPDEDRQLDYEDAIMSVEARAVRGMRALRIFATMGSALGFLGAAVEIYWIFNGDHGLLGLEAGLVENIGFGRAVISIGLGIATSALALGSWSALKPVARRLILDCRRMAATVESLLLDAAPESDEEE